MRLKVILLVGATIVSGVILHRTEDKVRAEEPISAGKSAHATVRVGAACTLKGVIDTAHATTLMGGVYQQGIGETTLRASCNDSNGFAIYAVGYTDDIFGKTVLTTSVGEEYGINTGTATSGNNSNWAMKLLSVSNGDDTAVIQNNFDSYHAVPEGWTMVASKDSATSTLGGIQVKSTYAVYISNTQVAGTYEGKVRYVLMNPATEMPLSPQNTETGKICYYANASTALGSMGCQTVSTSATSATLLASNFSRDGYGFAGWSNKYDYATNTDFDLKFYGPQETISFTAGQYTGNNPGLSLYAVWVKSEGSLQDQSKVTTLCGTSPTTGRLTIAPTNGTANLSSVSALTDSRDNQTYAIARLADGKCWMIENLRLESEYTTRSGDEALAQGYGTSITYGDFTGLADAESADFDTNPPVANSLYSTDGTTANTIQGGNSSYYYVRMPRYNNANTRSRASSPTNNSVAMYSYGNYYTWAAAMANVKQYTGVASTDDDGKTSETANTSLCPSGWKLPRGGDKSREATNDFWALVVTGINDGINPANYDSSLSPLYNGVAEAGPVVNKLRSYPNNFVYSGYMGNNSVSGLGSGSRYWSSTTMGSNFAHTLTLSGDNYVSPGGSGSDRNRGRNIRCMVNY